APSRIPWSRRCSRSSPTAPPSRASSPTGAGRSGADRPATGRTQSTEGRSPRGPALRMRSRRDPGAGPAGSLLLGELVGVLGADGALVGAADLRLRVAAALPVRTLDALAGLEVLVDLEEVLDLQAVEFCDVGQLLTAHLSSVAHRHRHDLVVAARLVAHAEHAQGAAADQAAREGRLLEQHQAVQRIPVLAEGPLDEAVVVRVAGGGEQHPVESDAPVVVVHLVLVAIPPGDLDGHVEFHDTAPLLGPAAHWSRP